MLRYKAETHVPAGVLWWDCSALVIHLALNRYCLVQLPQYHLKPFLVDYTEVR